MSKPHPSGNSDGIRSHLARLKKEILLAEEQVKAARLPGSSAVAREILAGRRERYETLMRLFGSRSLGKGSVKEPEN
jgi:hypothetical protein